MFFRPLRLTIGEISGFPVGYKWAGRRQLCDSGVHAYLMRGIHGKAQEGAFSVVMYKSFKIKYFPCNSLKTRSGGYDDDLDLGDIV